MPARNVRWRLNLVVANVQITGLRTAATRQKIDPRGGASGAGAAQEEEEEEVDKKEEEEETKD